MPNVLIMQNWSLLASKWVRYRSNIKYTSSTENRLVYSRLLMSTLYTYTYRPLVNFSILNAAWCMSSISNAVVDVSYMMKIWLCIVDIKRLAVHYLSWTRWHAFSVINHAMGRCSGRNMSIKIAATIMTVMTIMIWKRWRKIKEIYGGCTHIFSSPNLSGRRVDVYHTSMHTWCGLSANLECRSELCCKRLAGNTGAKMTQNVEQNIRQGGHHVGHWPTF